MDEKKKLEKPRRSFKFYPGNFMSSSKVQEMNWEERGIYHWLISLSWMSGSIPADHQKLAKILQLSTKKFERVWKSVGVCFFEKPGDASKLLCEVFSERLV